MTDPTPDHAEEAAADLSDNGIPTHAYKLRPLVGLGGSAGGIPALQDFFRAMPADSGMAFVVVLHLAPEQESSLPQILQHCTQMPVSQVRERARIQPNHVYVIPPRSPVVAINGYLALASDPLTERGRHVAVDLFFRTLADTHGPHSAAIVMSGADSDGSIGIKRIKERGGLTVVQDPGEAEHAGMPRAAIGTGMVDWVLPVSDIPQKLLSYFQLERQLELPPEDDPPGHDSATAGAERQEARLRDVLNFLRTRTGRDFSYYKRATVVRRIARRMQVNGTPDMQGYVDCLRTRPGEAGALLQDLLISVTNFFRDADCFAALDLQLAEIVKAKGPGEPVRVWVPACATGEEAYSIAMMLAEKARALEASPPIQVFATDLDEEAIAAAREALYPPTIEADVPEELLRRYFLKEHHGYKVRRELREMVLFAQHDLLKDSPFSRLDLVSCRNLLIYLNRQAQTRAFEIFHFALLPHGRLFLGSSESAEDASTLFTVADKKNRIFLQRPVPRAVTPLPVPTRAGIYPPGPETSPARQAGPVVAGTAFQNAVATVGRIPRGGDPRAASWGELHYKLLESLAPPSVIVDAEHEIIHLSESAGRFLQFSGGEPSRNLMRAVHPSLRVELRAALLQSSQTSERARVAVSPVELAGESVDIRIDVSPAKAIGSDMFVVLFDARPTGAVVEEAPEAQPAGGDPLARSLDRELERLKAHLRDTVEQYEASTEELKASNEELQAMNEELRSATEELETSREELQSINEELSTVNLELKNKVDELAHSNSDMHNLMDATAIATIFLDRELRIARYTPSAVKLFNLIPGDVGRPLSDLASRLDYPELGDDARSVLDRLIPVEREVGLPDGKWFMSRLLPYRTLDDHIAGVVVTFIDVTERKQSEEVRRWLSAVVHSSTDAIVSFATDLTILSWNAGAERIFGYQADEAIGQSWTMLSDGAGAESEWLQSQLQLGRAVTNREMEQRRKDGTTVPVALSISPIRDKDGRVIGATTIARDIAEQRIAAEALRSSEEQLRLMVESAQDYAIFSTDLERRVTIWNTGAERLLGYSEKEVIGKSADIIFTAEDRAAGAPALESETALREGRASDDRFHERKDGSRFWAGGVMMLMRDREGREVGFVKILRDQTATREAQQALEKSQAELRAADEAKDRFLAVLSHELRNPLASIDSAAALMVSTSVPLADRSAAAQVVKRQSEAMKMLLDDLLDVSRLKLGRLDLRRQKVSIADIVAAAVETTRPAVALAGHRLQLDLPDYAIELDADPLRIGQVLSNLITNAAKYTPPGGIMRVKARLAGTDAVISVADNGIGMEPSQIERMFEMFAQGHADMDRTHGLGIGLALSRNIVEMHAGRIVASSPGPGKGTEVQVTLPGARAAGPAPTRAPAVAAPAAAVKKQRGLVLIADDNTDAAWGMARLLEIAGFTTHRVRGGVDAVKETRRQKPDVAILDIGMPDLNGHEAARQIRGTEWGRHMVLIAATGWGQESDERQALEAGFDAHMTKPVDLRKLSALVDELLAKKRGN